jgi:hypothetical protein
MCLANGILERVVEALNGVNAQKLVKGDDDLAIHIQDATMKTKTPTEGFQWLRNVVEKMRELPDSDFRIDDWEIWKSLLGLKEHCEEKDNGDAQQYVEILLRKIPTNTLQDGLRHKTTGTGPHHYWESVACSSTCESRASVCSYIWHFFTKSRRLTSTPGPLRCEHSSRLHCR